MSVSHLNSQQVNDAANLCQDPETKGFDLQAGQSWVYPTNYSVRDYQFNIIQEALHKNTLVSLPTGLGKTFIAAVVMYNFYRWYPHDKVIFMAPTRPLVKQQMDACYNITAIPQEVTAELTGSKIQQSRAEIWQSKRVFFITPQVLQNDLPLIIELGGKIKCLVFDEAHRAKGNHAYCEVIRKLLPKNKLFRVLALSATPGNSSKDVIDVMQNLLIAHVEFRSEESPDVKPYVFERALETVVVPLGEKLQQVKDQYVQILERYTRTLIQYKVIYGNCSNLSKGKIFMVMKEFQAKNSVNRSPNYAEIMKSLNICVTLYHAYETLIRCGLRAFLNFYEEHIKNPLLSGNVNLRQILEDLREYLGPGANVQSLPDGTFAEISAATKFGHPKLYKLRDILLTHFKHSDNSTRVIVFFEYRESASEAHALLSQSYPMIKPRVFVGQGSGVTQKAQINTIVAFRDGSCNTLLSTSIGEEGLDVGDVDLIVCFDIANKSPIRMIQRMGRTGRKKEGRVVVLVTEGKEQQTLKDCLIYKNNLGNFVSKSEQLEQGKYQDNPKMIPSYIQPKCQKMYITVKKPPATKKSGNLKNMLKRISSDNPKFNEDVEIIEITERIKNKVENFWDKEHPLQFNFEHSKINFKKHIEKQRKYQTHGTVRHSKQTEMFVSLLQFADSKRFNLPITQEISKFGVPTKILKQGDIRSMFSKPHDILSQENYVTSQYLGKQKDVSQLFPQELFDEISDFVLIKMTTKRNCKTCDLLFDCPRIEYPQPAKLNLTSMVVPDLSILDDVSAKDLEVFADSLVPKSKVTDLLDDDNDIFNDLTISEVADETLTKNKSMTYETPRNFDKILKSFRVCEDEEVMDIEEKSFGFQKPKGFDKVLNLLGDSVVEEFSTEMTLEVQSKTVDFDKRTNEDLSSIYAKVLSFFKLQSLADVFVNVEQNCTEDLDATVIYTPELSIHKSPRNITPDLFEGSSDLFPSSEKNKSISNTPESPVLCTNERVVTLQAKKKLFTQSKEEEVRKKPRLSNLHLQRKSFFESTRRKSVDCKEIPKVSPTALDISDICDLSSFMDMDVISENNEDKTILEQNEKEESDTKLIKQNEKSAVETSAEDEKSNTDLAKQEDDLDISDLCDLSIFGLAGENASSGKEDEGKLKNKLNSAAKKNNHLSQNMKPCTESAKKSSIKDLNIEDLCDIANFFEPEKPKKTNDISELEDFCDMSFFMVSQKKKPDIEYQSSKLEMDLDDFCDSSFFLNTPKKKVPNSTILKCTGTNIHGENNTDICKKLKDCSTSRENNSAATPKKQKDNLNESLIDLTDSDLEYSPCKSKQTETNKPLSQLSISQMLSLVAKNDNALSNSQKENVFTPKAKTQKSWISLSTKKKALQLKQNVTPKMSQKKASCTVTPKTKTNKFNISLPGDSDDEFEDSFKSPIFAKPKAMSSQVKKKETKVERTKQNKKKKRLFDFIEEEAEVSQDESVVISSDEDSGEDCYEASFVADETQDLLNTTNMQVKYMQSVKSPVRRGAFKIPEKFKHNITNVFSQEVNNEDNTYMNDSFCVDDNEDEQDDTNDISELELLEKRLKEMKKGKKRKKVNEEINSKRRRIIVLSDSD